MFESSQKTIKESVQLEGVGLHNGIKVNLSLIPAEANAGIKFKRIENGNHGLNGRLRERCTMLWEFFKKLI